MEVKSIRLDTPAGKAEAEILKGMGIGEVRKGDFLAGIPATVDWVCMTVKQNFWEFEGRFCGIPFLVVEIKQTETSLVFSGKEVL